MKPSRTRTLTDPVSTAWSETCKLATLEAVTYNEFGMDAVTSASYEVRG